MRAGLRGEDEGDGGREGVRGARVQAERMKLPAMVIEVEQSGVVDLGFAD